MEFSDINLSRKGSENVFFRVLRKKIHSDFFMGENQVSAPPSGKRRISTTIQFKIVYGKKMIELELVLHKEQVNHLWLSMAGSETFYALDKPIRITMKKMDEFAPALKKFIIRGIVDEKIFGKITSSKGDDWSAQMAKVKDLAPTRRYVEKAA